MAAANEMTGHKLFNAPMLSQVIAEYKESHEGINMLSDNIKQVIKKYNPNKIRIGVLGSHSALEIASGAKQEGYETVVVCQKGREKTYTKYYRNLFDHVIMLDKFSEITSEAT